jgi:hypothetical protein
MLEKLLIVINTLYDPHDVSVFDMYWARATTVGFRLLGGVFFRTEGSLKLFVIKPSVKYMVMTSDL